MIYVKARSQTKMYRSILVRMQTAVKFHLLGALYPLSVSMLRALYFSL